MSRRVFNLAQDRRYLILSTTYLAVLLLFSSRFYLATEDYEAVIAARLIGEGIPVGKNTGWPYMPLAAYLFYCHSLLFGADILGFRILVAAFLVASVFPIYLTLRQLCSPFIAFALTIFSFSLVTFPHPRLEYYIEGSLVSFSVFFAMRSISSSKQKDVCFAAAFLFAAFASRGFPNTGLLVLLLPTALLITQRAIKNSPDKMSEVVPDLDLRSTKTWLWLLLAIPCFVYMMKFLRRAVYWISFFEYASLLGPAHFRSLQDYRVPVSFGLLCMLLIIYGGAGLLRNPPRLEVDWIKNSLASTSKCLTTRQILLPFFVCAVLFVLALYMVGQPIEHIYFFFFPMDIILDHLNQLQTGRSHVTALWFFVTIAIIYMSSKYGLGLIQAKRILFFVLLLPLAFARSFPGFNMLYFISFILAIFIAVFIPIILGIFFRGPVSVCGRLQHSLAVFFLLYALVSNSFLLVQTQLMDFRSGNVNRFYRNPVNGIWIEKDIIKFFEDVDHSLRSMKAHDDNIAFLSNRYLNYVPLLYGYRDAFAGQNLIMGLGKTWSYDDLLKIEAKNTESTSGPNRVIYAWRQAAATKVENAKANVIVMSLYDTNIATQIIEPSSDPFREYVRQKFVISKIIEPTMKVHRRSRFSEGAVILRRTRASEKRPVQNANQPKS